MKRRRWDSNTETRIVLEGLSMLPKVQELMKEDMEKRGAGRATP